MPTIGGNNGPAPVRATANVLAQPGLVNTSAKKKGGLRGLR
jgi:hypothetical protein